MGKIIAVANQKGGVGKTTTTINLSAAIAEKDRKVLLVDLDSQSNATSGVGIEKNNVENSTYELISGEASFEDCVVHTEFKNLDVIPSSPDLTAAEIELLSEEQRDSRLKNALDKIKDQYEFIIIDCPPSLNLLTVNALTAADSVLVPIQCEYYALEGLSLLLQTISLVKERINPNLKIEGIVFTMYDPRVRLSGQVVHNVKENLNEKTFRTVIPRNVRLAEAPSHGKPVMYYTRFCSGTRAYRNLAKEVVAVYEAELSEAEKKKALLKAEEIENKKEDAEAVKTEADTAETTEQETASEKTETSEETAESEETMEVEESSEAEEAAAQAEETVEEAAESGKTEEAGETAEEVETEETPESVEETEETAETEEAEKSVETVEEPVEIPAADEAAEETLEEPIEESVETSEKEKANEITEKAEAPAEPEEPEEKPVSKSKANKYADIIAKAEKEINAGISE